MKKTILTIFTILLPFASFAAGIPEENKARIFGITLIGFLIVITALIVVSISVALMSGIIINSEERKKRRQESKRKQEKAKKQRTAEPDSAATAIVTALHLELKARQDEENAILTIRKIVKPYSAWNNKAYGMRNPSGRII